MTNRGQAERWLVVGLGNAMAGDDSVGLDIVREARPLTSDCDFLEFPLAGSHLFELLDREEPLLFVDAVVSGAPPGTIHLLNLPSGAVQPRSLTSLSTHAWNLGEVLALRDALGLTTPRIVLLGVDVSPATDDGSGAIRTVSVAIACELRGLVQFLQARDGWLGGTPLSFPDTGTLAAFLVTEHLLAR